jgi:hypothetical protein
LRDLKQAAAYCSGKAKGPISLAGSRPLLPFFFEDLVRLPNHNYFVASGSFETCEPCGPRFPFSPVAPFVVRAFPVSSKAPGYPFASRDPLPVLLMVRCLLSSLEDLSSVELKILLISAIARGFSKFCDVEMMAFLWKL